MKTESNLGYVGVLVAVGVLAYLRINGHPISALWSGVIVTGGYFACAALIVLVSYIKDKK